MLRRFHEPFQNPQRVFRAEDIFVEVLARMLEVRQLLFEFRNVKTSFACHFCSSPLAAL